jgi:serine O-acetyltransferase
MDKLVRMDLYRYSKQTGFAAFIRCFFSNPGFRFVYVMRICKATSIYNPIGIIFRIYFRALRVKFGYQIPFRTKIGGGFVLGHFGNIIVNQMVVIGENCSVAQGVTIGIVSRGVKKGSPVIGNRVWIGPNAVVVGNIKIGNDVLIAPLSYVTEDIPDNAVVAGNPAKIINYNGSKGYIKWIS